MRDESAVWWLVLALGLLVAWWLPGVGIILIAWAGVTLRESRRDRRD